MRQFDRVAGARLAEAVRRAGIAPISEWLAAMIFSPLHSGAHALRARTRNP